MNNTYSHGESSRIGIAADGAASVIVAVGDTIRCVRGSIWLTQEGDTRDYALVPGVTFCVSVEGRAVLGAIGEPAIVSVTRRDAVGNASLTPGSVRIDSIARIAEAARRAQADYVAATFAKLARQVTAWVRRAKLRYG